MPGGWEWLIIVGVLLLLFGAKRLPEMARSVGQSARVFKGEMKGLKADDEAHKNDKTDKPETTDKPADAATPTPPSALPTGQQTSQEPTRTPQPGQAERPQ
ncbi:Sec-independent protein translocase subunit TatA [Pseudonocardia bannensis]|uniref:Sec-independent protein translocase protein TatA n=1 Tax=Pseudonocardia bannensis TaxID=630973 RepID=A0A848DDZ0_9PSEU|nr:Sec-independent protein translocase subunit TatA [Pseudonocardia bannensis]NMH90819.1 Sec-independent protein translocase subunit TatA [Pseudonocardia bannensis]